MTRFLFTLFLIASVAHAGPRESSNERGRTVASAKRIHCPAILRRLSQYSLRTLMVGGTAAALTMGGYLNWGSEQSYSITAEEQALVDTPLSEVSLTDLEDDWPAIARLLRRSVKARMSHEELGHFSFAMREEYGAIANQPEATWLLASVLWDINNSDLQIGYIVSALRERAAEMGLAFPSGQETGTGVMDKTPWIKEFERLGTFAAATPDQADELIGLAMKARQQWLLEEFKKSPNKKGAMIGCQIGWGCGTGYGGFYGDYVYGAQPYGYGGYIYGGYAGYVGGLVPGQLSRFIKEPLPSAQELRRKEMKSWVGLE